MESSCIEIFRGADVESLSRHSRAVALASAPVGVALAVASLALAVAVSR